MTPPAVLCGLDGVVWLSRVPISGAVHAVGDLRAAGHRVLFVTNNSAPLLADHELALAAVGIDGTGDVLTSAQAAALLVQPGERVLVAAGTGVVEALQSRGAEVVVNDRDDVPLDVDAVVVGLHRWFDYDGLRRATTAVRRGARLLAANDDATYPTPDGLIPGGGAILAAVERATGVHAEIAGKPYPPMAALVRAVLGVEDSVAAVMVGDRPDTDGRFARTLGCRFAMVLSGVVSPASLADRMIDGVVDGVRPDWVFPDLRAAADHLLAAVSDDTR
jgi:HAD superfamily hydrolase (TIGR01450 family)